MRHEAKPGEKRESDADGDGSAPRPDQTCMGRTQVSGTNYSCVSQKRLGAVGERFKFKYGTEREMGCARKAEQIGQRHDTMKAQLKVELTVGE
jgi:hypothetical protein